MAKQKEKKLFALALSVTMAVSALPTVAFAEEFSENTVCEVSEENEENSEDEEQNFEVTEKEGKQDTEVSEEKEPEKQEETEKEDVEENTGEETENNEEINKEENTEEESEKEQEETVLKPAEELITQQPLAVALEEPAQSTTLTAVANGVTVSMTSTAFKENYKLYVFEDPNLGMYADSYKNKITSKKADSVIVKNYSFIITEIVDGIEKNVCWENYFTADEIPYVAISGLPSVKQDSDIGVYFSTEASRMGDTFEINDVLLEDGSISFKMSEYFRASKNETSVNSGFGSYLAITQVKKMAKCDYDETVPSRWTVAPVSLEPTTEGITYEVENDVDLDNQGGSNISPIKIIIPKDFDAEKFAFDGSQAVMDALEYNHYNAYQPGDKTQIKIIVENNSDYDYKFNENSFKVGKADFEKQEGRGVKCLNNNAVKQLLDITNYWDNEDAMNDMDAILKEKGYDGGVDDFHKFFTDFYNFENGTEINNINGISDEDMYKITGENGAMPICEETNAVLAQLFDDVFYQKLFSLKPNTENALAENYTIGKLAEGSDEMNGYVKKNMGEVKKGESSNEMTFIVAIDGNGTGNMYQNYDFGLKFGFEMTKVVPEEKPDTPPGGGGEGGRTGDITPDDEPEKKTPPVVIEEEEVPLAELPETVIEEEEVPLAEIPQEEVEEVVEIPKEEVPLGEAPATGDSADAGVFAALFAAASAVLVLLRKKKN